MNDTKERDRRDIEELVNRTESHPRDIRLEMEYVRQLMDDSEHQVEPPWRT